MCSPIAQTIKYYALLFLYVFQPYCSIFPRVRGEEILSLNILKCFRASNLQRKVIAEGPTTTLFFMLRSVFKLRGLNHIPSLSMTRPQKVAFRKNNRTFLHVAVVGSFDTA